VWTLTLFVRAREACCIKAISPEGCPCLTELGKGLERDLAQVVSEPIFDIPWLVEAACHQRFDPILGGASTERSDARAVFADATIVVMGFSFVFVSL
jgi:hypothetical protein